MPIHELHIDHNTTYLPPPPPKKNLHNHCFQFLLGITVVPREIQDNGSTIFFGGGGREEGGRMQTKCIMVYVKMVNR